MADMNAYTAYNDMVYHYRRWKKGGIDANGHMRQFYACCVKLMQLEAKNPFSMEKVDGAIVRPKVCNGGDLRQMQKVTAVVPEQKQEAVPAAESGLGAAPAAQAQRTTQGTMQALMQEGGN